MWYLFDYILHFLTSHSTHGTHSPFVYDLADRAIYSAKTVQSIRGDNKIRPTYKKTLLRMLNHLAIRSITDFSDSDTVHADALIFSAHAIPQDKIEQYLDGGKLIVVDGIHDDKLSRKNWKAMTSLSEVTVSIDLFYFGLLIRREEQFKEDFKLRYPFWV